MPLLKRVRVLAAKIETTIGTFEAVVAADADYNVFDATMQPNIEYIARPSQGSFGHLVGAVGAYMATCNFKLELTGSGTPGTAPQWALALLPACGWSHTAGTFTPLAEAAGTNVKTVSLALYENGLLKKMRGCSGNFKITFGPGKPIMFDFTFQGAWIAPTDATILAPTYPAQKPIKAAGSTFTIASWAPCFQSMTIDSGNTLTPRECGTAAGGIHSYAITDRLVTGSFNPESALVATKDNYGLWIANTPEAFSYAATDGTDTVTFAGPACERTNMQEGDRNGMQTDEITFKFGKSAEAGNDEFTIDF